MSHNAGRRSAPPGVDGGDSSSIRRDNQDRHAIRGLDGEPHAGFSRNERVAFGRLAAPRDVDHQRGVDLLESPQRAVGSGVARSERVFDARQRRQSRRAIACVREKETQATGWATWATMTCFLKSSSIRSSKRTSLGRRFRLIVSILSCSLSSA